MCEVEMAKYVSNVNGYVCVKCKWLCMCGVEMAMDVSNVNGYVCVKWTKSFVGLVRGKKDVFYACKETSFMHVFLCVL